jgi:hypothetical protein
MEKHTRVDQYGLRVNYRFAGNPDVHKHDIVGEDKGQRASEFCALLKGTDFCAISVFDLNAND